MRAFRELRFQFRVPAPELDIAIAEFAGLGLQPLDLRREPPDLFGQGINGVLLLVWVGRAGECLPTKGLFKKPEEGVRPTEVGLIDLPGHGIGQLRRHDSPT